MKTLQEPLVSDNPFRLLGVPSDTPYSVLRRKADTLARNALVGLPHEVPMRDQLGERGLEDLPSEVRALASDPTRRTLYRFLWPFEARAIDLLAAGGNVSRSELRPYSLTQLLFLDAWLEFLREKRADDLRIALAEAAKLFADPGCDDFLASLVTDEDDVPALDSRDTVREARQALAAHLLRRAATVAADEIAGGTDALALEILAEVFASPFSDDQKESALGPVVLAAERLVESLREAEDDLWENEPTPTPQFPAEVDRLRALARAIDQRHPGASGWRAAIREYNGAYAWRVREYAIDLQEEYRFAEALHLIETALALDVVPDVREDLEQVRRVLARARRKQALDEADARAQAQVNVAPLPRPEPTSSGTPWGCLTYIFIGLVVLFFKTLFPLRDPSPGSTGTPSPTWSSESSWASPVVPEMTRAERDRIADRFSRLQNEYNKLDAEIIQIRPTLETLDDKMEREEEALAKRRRALERERKKLEGTRPTRARADAFERDRRQYNRDADRHNDRLADVKRKWAAFNRRVDRFNVLAKELDRMNGQ